MADLRKKMSLDNSAQILTTHDLGNLRILQQHHHPQQLHHQQHNLTTGVTTNVATTTSKALFGGNLKNLNSNSNMILSTIPLDGRALIIPTIANGTQQTQQQQSISNSQQQQQQRFTVTSGTSTNGFRSLNAATTLATVTGTTTTSAAASNNLSNLLAAAGVTTKTTILNTQNNSNTINTNNSSNHNNTNNTMPTTSKYLLVQQNSNGQYTTYEGSATTATPTGNGGTNVGNIVLLATEPLTTGNGNEQQQHVITTTTSTTTGNDNDEELRPLAWLSDSNLIKGIVTTNGSNGNIVTTVGGNNAKRQGNICIVNASNAHDLIEELPPHVASEENVIATTAHSTDASSKAQITTLSVSDFQQQFITSNKRFTPITVSSNSITNSSNSGNTNQLNTLANFTLAQDANLNTATTRDGTQHIYSNIAALGATTSVHVGPSGTTTVVEYKTTNGNFLPTQRQLINGSSVVVSAANNNNNNAAMNTTITATNLSNNHNNNNNTNVPSSSSSMSGATSTIQKTLMTLPNATTLLTTNTTNGNQQTVVNSNSTTNTVYHAQKQQQISNNHNNNNNNMNMNTNTSTTVSTTTTTHHPHKKYLREKMNVLDHGGGGGNASSSNTNTNTNNNAGVALALVVSSAPTVLTTQNTVPSSAITVVASPASSLSSQSSSSTSSSTAAVNGGNSPISKSFFALGNGNGTTAIAVNYASNSSNSPSPSSSAPLTTIGSLPASYTIVSQASQQNVGSSPVIVSSPESQSTKDYYTLTSVPQSNNNTANNQQRYYHQSPNNQNQHSHSHNQQQYHQHQHQQQQQQHNHQHNSMRSPISHSSYDNDSLKDFDISPNDSTTNSMGARLSATSTPQHQNNVSYHTCTSKSGSSHAAGQGNNTPQKQKHPNNVPYDPLVHTHNKPPYSFSSLIFMAIESSQEKALPVKEIYAWIVQHFPYFKTAPTGWKNSVRHNLSLNKSFVKVEKAPNMGKGSLWRVEQQQRQNLIQSLTRSPFFPNSAVDKIALKSGNTNNSGNNMQLNNNTNYDVIDGAMSPPSQASPTPQSTPNSKTHMNSRFDPQLFPNLSKTFKDMSDASSALSDVPDDEYPSDYSTTNHNNINMNNNAGNNNIHNETQKNSNNKNKYNNYGGGSDVVDSGANSNCNGSTTMMGAFSNYESIERLARDCGAENIDDVNAATAMLALKHGPKVFAETFQNGAPVITSSPSEDHTYSAGNNSAATSGASTPLINGNSSGNLVVLNGNGSATTNGNKQNGSDNQSNCASSDAAYESSEESHNISPEELEDQKRYRDGVDALLSLSLSSVVDSTSGSPVKRPASTSVEEEHLAASLESNSNMSNSSPPQHNLGKMSILTNSTTFPSRHHHQQQQQQYNNNNSNNNSNGNGNGINILDEGYNTQSYYGINNTNSSHHHHYNTQQNHLTLLTTPSSSKKVKPLRSLRTKIKRKAPWMR